MLLFLIKSLKGHHQVPVCSSKITKCDCYVVTILGYFTFISHVYNIMSWCFVAIFTICMTIKGCF